MMRQISCGEDKKAKEKDYCQKSVCISDNCWIERPRFFNGQLLTDTDLKAGMNYVIEKNKLHNRYMHGWGVACGLKVKCYPCCAGHGSSGKVVVEPGYAIDCCGNDIVVCDEQEFDVVKRINEMKKKKMAEQSPCEPGAAEPVSPCSDKEEKYYLVLSYKEEDAKPATALRADDPCSIQRCVPSRTKECFELNLVEYCTLEQKPEDNLLIRILKCSEIYDNTYKSVFPDDKKINLMVKGEEDLRNFIREYYKAQPSHVRCDVLDHLEQLERIELLVLGFQIYIDCICQALLIPCPTCIEDEVLILATITVKNNKIHHICNLSRKYVLTPMSFNYWILPFINMIVKLQFGGLSTDKFVINSLSDFVEFLCCIFDLSQAQSLPPYVYFLKFFENDFEIPKMIGKNLHESLANIAKRVMEPIDPQNISLESALNKKSKESETLLKNLKIEVVGKEKYEPSLKGFSLDDILSTIPFARPGSKVIQLVDDNDNVMGFRTVKEKPKAEPAAAAEEVSLLKTELEKMSKKMAAMEKELKEMKKKTPGPKTTGTKKK